MVLVDEQSEAGGALLGSTDTIDAAPALDWVATAVTELATYPDVLHLQRTTAFGLYDDGFVLALERRRGTRHQSRQRVHRIRAKHVVVATGAVRVRRSFSSRLKTSPPTSECSTSPVEKRATRSVWLSQMSSSVSQDRISRLMTVESLLAKRGGVAIESRVEWPKRNWSPFRLPPVMN